MKLSLAILFVRDIARMQAFYGGVLGLAPREAADGFVVLDGGGCALMLHAMRGAGPADADPVVRTESPHKLCFRADDVAAEREALIARGVPMRELHHWGEMTYCDGVDPEGNVFQVTSR